eukprot:TRINITY_DN2890_c0_g1_i3.p1 TRINITY_DN2890_c0_g1~~TRINITY_DN2890_c0_g1_i3.p1  ORF type:complete len:215 (+),score=-28.37 TRINITY_DN2890_c0_g1_i3:135-779(+)
MQKIGKQHVYFFQSRGKNFPHNLSQVSNIPRSFFLKCRNVLPFQVITYIFTYVCTNFQVLVLFWTTSEPLNGKMRLFNIPYFLIIKEWIYRNFYENCDISRFEVVGFFFPSLMHLSKLRVIMIFLQQYLVILRNRVQLQISNLQPSSNIEWIFFFVKLKYKYFQLLFYSYHNYGIYSMQSVNKKQRYFQGRTYSILWFCYDIIFGCFLELNSSK